VSTTLRKISKIGATRCQILRLIETKFDFGWRFTTDPTGELTALPQELTALPRPPSCI